MTAINVRSSFPVLCLLAAAAAGCSGAGRMFRAPLRFDGAASPPAEPGGGVSAPRDDARAHGGRELPVSFKPPAAEAGGAADEASARHVIYTARLQIVVTAVEPALLDARRLAEEADGYLQEQTRDRLVLRVPAARFHDTLGRIERLGSVADRELKAADVTDEHVDLRARLRNARAVEARLREMLARAKDVKEALEVEKEMCRVGEEIERLEGRLKLLGNQVAFSTIAVTFATKAPVAAEIEPLVRLPFGWIRSLELPSLIEQAARRARWD